MLLNRIGFKIWLVLLIIVSLFMLHDTSEAGTIVVKPGRFDYFALQTPDKMIAGENFVIKVYAYDSNNNLITNFSEYDKDFKVEVNGAAVVQPSVLTGACFSGGMANVLINQKKAEKVTFSIKESGGTVPVISRDFLVIPNRLDHFVLQSPNSAVAGNVFGITVVAKDKFDNTVNDLEVGSNLKITSTGTASIKTGSPALNFVNGTGTINVVSEKTGMATVELQDVITGSSGRTQSVSITPSLLSSFKIQAPRNVMAGEPFDLLIAAYDAFGNVVTNYASAGSGIRLSTTGTSKIEPSFIGPIEFKNGQAVIKAVYEKAEDIQVIAKENNREQEGRTDNVLVMNANPDHFVVITPDTALSGQRFKIKVEAYDRYNNIVSNFNLIGHDVGFSTSGSGTISPAKISPTDFVSGLAVVDVVYDKAESFLISAKMLGEQSSRVTMKEHEVSEEKAETAKKDKRQKMTDKGPVLAAKLPAEKKKEEETKKIKEAKTSKTETKKEPRKKEEPGPVIAKKVPEGSPGGKKSVEAKVMQKPATKGADKASVPGSPSIEQKSAAAPKKSAVSESTAKVKGAEDIYQVSRVSIIEVKDKVMLVVNVTNPNGHFDYKDEIESRYGKEWLKINLKPAVNKTEKNFKFNSAFIGEVRIEEDKASKNTLSMYIELLPAGVTYDIARVKNNLIVTVANP